MGAVSIGARFADRYEIEALLGEGGMGAVYRARHAFTGRRVALKVIHELVAASETARQRFLREAQAPSAIGHPSLVDVLDAGDQDGVLYLAMELLEGRDLGRALSEGTLSPDELIGIAIELLGALDAAHQQGLVHRDIKPENVFVLAEPKGASRIKLLDFGISGLMAQDEGDGSNLTRTGTIVGTPLFMSPEQARGEKVDGRADVWAVGAILFMGLTGRPHFDAPNYNLLISKIITEEPPPVQSVRPDLPGPLAVVIDRALQKPLERRWPSAAAMRDALAACPAMGGHAARAQMGMAETAFSDGAGTPRSQRPPAPVAPPSSPPPSAAPSSAPTPLQGAYDPGAPAVAAQASPPERGGRGLGLLVGAAALLLLGVVGGGIGVWMLSRGGAAPPTPPEASRGGEQPEPATPPGEPPSPLEPSSPGAAVAEDEEAREAPDAVASDVAGADRDLAGAQRDLDEAQEDLETAGAILDELNGEDARGRSMLEKARRIQRVQRQRDARRRAREAAAQQRCIGECRAEHHRCSVAAVGDGRAFHECVQQQARCIAGCR